MSSKAKVKHPYIDVVPGVCGGRPVIRGTRIPVQTIVVFYKMGQPIAEILESYPGLDEAQVFDALSYYYDYREEIDQAAKEEMKTAGEDIPW